MLLNQSRASPTCLTRRLITFVNSLNHFIVHRFIGRSIINSRNRIGCQHFKVALINESYCFMFQPIKLKNCKNKDRKKFSIVLPFNGRAIHRRYSVRLSSKASSLNQQQGQQERQKLLCGVLIKKSICDNNFRLQFCAHDVILHHA